MRAGIYARISKDTEGTELGVSRQRADCQAEADRRGWDVVETYIDNDVSATRSKARPEYDRMLRDIEHGYIRAIVVWDIDRLTRTPRELEDVIDLANAHGLALANVGGDIDLSTDDGRMMARIKGTVARREVEYLSRRLKSKFQEKAQKGEPHGRSPYGYTRVDGRDIPSEPQASVVRHAAASVLAGDSLRSICRRLNDEGEPGPQAPTWNTTILRQILLRPSNAGLRQFRGEVIGKSTNDPILDEETYVRLQAILTDPSRKSNHAGPSFKHLLSGLARCGRCGGTMRRQTGRTAGRLADGTPKRQPPSYQCSDCLRVRRQQAPVDFLIEEVIIARLSKKGAVHRLPNGDASRTMAAQRAIEAVDAKLSIAADQFAEGVLTGDQLKRITMRLRTERDTAEEELRKSQPSLALQALTKGDIRAGWAPLSMEYKREVVDLLMTVTINPTTPGAPFNPDDVVVTWRT